MRKGRDGGEKRKKKRIRCASQSPKRQPSGTPTARANRGFGGGIWVFQCSFKEMREREGMRESGW